MWRCDLNTAWPHWWGLSVWTRWSWGSSIIIICLALSLRICGPAFTSRCSDYLLTVWWWYLRICKNKVSKWKVFKNSIVSINVGNLSGEYKERLRPRLFMSVNPVLMGPSSFNHVIWCIWMYLSRRNWCISTHWFYVQHLGTSDWIPEVAWRHEGMDLIETEMMISRSFLCDFVWYLLCDFSIIIIRLLFVI